MFVIASVVTGVASARMTNTTAIEHSHLMMHVLAGGSTSACSKFARECNVACGQYHNYVLRVAYPWNFDPED